MKINGIETQAKKFAFDGSHKFYLLEDEQDIIKAQSKGYKICDIENLEKTYFKCSRGMRFIQNYKLNTLFAKQDFTAYFE